MTKQQQLRKLIREEIKQAIYEIDFSQSIDNYGRPATVDSMLKSLVTSIEHTMWVMSNSLERGGTPLDSKGKKDLVQTTLKYINSKVKGKNL
jgi:hypothetical protein